MPRRFVSSILTRLRVVLARWLERFGVGEGTLLTIMAVVIALLASLAAVGFHELILFIRHHLFESESHRPAWQIALIPAGGGLLVGAIAFGLSKLLRRPMGRGHGVVDVIESVIRARGFVRPFTAVETITGASITIGTGGSAGAEGPIVQIGAAISSWVGQGFRISRKHMPVLIACGAAAGISAIFNAPLGGLLFVLEVILLDFSLRAITPIVIASVVANVATRLIFEQNFFGTGHEYTAIFASVATTRFDSSLLHAGEILNVAALGLACGLAGALLIRAMLASEALFGRLPIHAAVRPCVGGLFVGLMGVLWFALAPAVLPFAGDNMPPFFSDGYSVIERLLSDRFYSDHTAGVILPTLAVVCLAKILATSITLGSGAGGGVIAPSLTLGALVGGCVGQFLAGFGLIGSFGPEMYALVGMGAVLAAVVHAPLAAILILFELTQDWRVTLPAMLACVLAVGIGRLVHAESVYTHGLLRRGIRPGSRELDSLRRSSVETIGLDPAVSVKSSEPVETLLDRIDRTGNATFVVVDNTGQYVGMIFADDVNRALLQREAAPLLIVEEIMRTDIPLVRNSSDLASVYELFGKHDVAALPVSLDAAPNRVIGLVSRARILRRHQNADGHAH